MHKEKYIRSLKQNTWNKLAAKKSCWILGLQTVHQSVSSLCFPRRPLPLVCCNSTGTFYLNRLLLKKKILSLPHLAGTELSYSSDFLFFTLNSWDTKVGQEQKPNNCIAGKAGGSVSLGNSCQEKLLLPALPGRRCQGAAEGAGFPLEWVCWLRETWGALVSQNQGLSASTLPCFA